MMCPGYRTPRRGRIIHSGRLDYDALLLGCPVSPRHPLLDRATRLLPRIRTTPAIPIQQKQSGPGHRAAPKSNDQNDGVDRGHDLTGVYLRGQSNRIRIQQGGFVSSCSTSTARNCRRRRRLRRPCGTTGRCCRCLRTAQAAAPPVRYLRMRDERLDGRSPPPNHHRPLSGSFRSTPSAQVAAVRLPANGNWSDLGAGSACEDDRGSGLAQLWWGRDVDAGEHDHGARWFPRAGESGGEGGGSASFDGEPRDCPEVVLGLLDRVVGHEQGAGVQLSGDLHGEPPACRAPRLSTAISARRRAT